MLIIRACWTRWGLRKFQEEVNIFCRGYSADSLAGAFKLVKVDCHHGFLGLRLVMVAVLEVTMDLLPKEKSCDS